MPGFGIYPSAVSPFGLATPIPATPPPSGPSGTRFINPATGDYQQDPTTRQLAQMPSTRQRVLLAVTTLKKSSTVNPNFGIRPPRKMGTLFDSEQRHAVRAALQHLTETEQVIRIDAITVERGISGRSRTIIDFTDLETGQPDKVTA
jgi:hypothetical protein